MDLHILFTKFLFHIATLLCPKLYNEACLVSTLIFQYDIQRIQYYYPDLIELQNAPLTYSLSLLMPCVELLLHLLLLVTNILTYFVGFDENGVRKLKVVNPNGNHFEPIDPDLVKYLTNRNNIK